MKTLLTRLAIWVSVSACAFAQYGSVVGGRATHRTFGSPSGFGNVLFPGVGAAPPIPNVFHRNPTTFAQRLGATVGGFPGPIIGGPARRSALAPAIVPVAVPVYGGYGYGYPYSVDPPQPNVTVVAPQPAPSVVINQYYTPDSARPVVRDYTETPLPEARPSDLRSFQAPIPSHPEPERVTRPVEAERKATIYLIAMKDESIKAAYGYWIEGDTLHYITPQGSHNRVSVSLVDRDFSEQLNRERNIEFKLEIPR